MYVLLYLCTHRNRAAQVLIKQASVLLIFCVYKLKKWVLVIEQMCNVYSEWNTENAMERDNVNETTEKLICLANELGKFALIVTPLITSFFFFVKVP